MRPPPAETLARKAADDLLVARKLVSCADIDDSIIGFYAQQAVEKSLKAVLTLRGIDFPLMEHDLDFLMDLATGNAVETPHELIAAGWLTAWATTYESCEASPGKLDRRNSIEIAEIAACWCRALLDQTPAGLGDSHTSDKPPPPPPSVPGLGRPETSV